MSEELAKNEHEVGFVQKYATQYTWTLSDWYLLYDLLYKKGISSNDFDLNGTDDCTCRIHLKPETSKESLSLEFSDAEEIEAMTLNFCVGNTWWPNIYHHSKPIRGPYSLDLVLDKDLSNSTVTTDANNALVIVCKITIVKVSDTVDPLNPTVRSPQILDTNNRPRNILANFQTTFDSTPFCDIEFEMSNFDEKVFEQFLNYVCCGEVINLEEIVEEMIVIANFYNVSELKMICENIMLKTLSENSAVRYVILASTIDSDALTTAALDLILKNPAIIEKAALVEDAATMIDLRQILEENQREQ